MKKCKFLVLIMSALFFLPQMMLAQEDVENLQQDIILLEHQEVGGVWMPMPTFEIVLQGLEERKTYREGYIDMSEEAENLEKAYENEFRKRLRAEANADQQRAYKEYALIGGSILSVGLFITGFILGS